VSVIRHLGEYAIVPCFGFFCLGAYRFAKADKIAQKLEKIAKTIEPTDEDQTFWADEIIRHPFFKTGKWIRLQAISLMAFSALYVIKIIPV
jgi:hypothetical protein